MDLITISEFQTFFLKSIFQKLTFNINTWTNNSFVKSRSERDGSGATFLSMILRSFDRAQRVLSTRTIFSFWYSDPVNLWRIFRENPGFQVWFAFLGGSEHGISLKRCRFDRARHVLSWYTIFIFWYNLRTNPDASYR